MNAASKALLVILLVAFAGCSLFPKKVEFFQDKVKEVPKYSNADKETQKETAELAARKAQETYKAALTENSSTNLLSPAEDTALLTLSLSKSLGPPLNPWKEEAELLAAKLDRAEARLNARLDKFSDKQQENVGKKIEGTGLFQVPYFVWLGAVGLFLFVLVFAGVVVLKIVSLSNPAVALGTSAASLGASRLARGFAQTIRGGENFKDEIKRVFGETDTTAKTVLEIFKRSHMTSQDEDIQNSIQHLTK